MLDLISHSKCVQPVQSCAWPCPPLAFPLSLFINSLSDTARACGMRCSPPGVLCVQALLCPLSSGTEVVDGEGEQHVDKLSVWIGALTDRWLHQREPWPPLISADTGGAGANHQLLGPRANKPKVQTFTYCIDAPACMGKHACMCVSVCVYMEAIIMKMKRTLKCCVGCVSGLHVKCLSVLHKP
jgi:hypothetical protein